MTGALPPLPLHKDGRGNFHNSNIAHFIGYKARLKRLYRSYSRVQKVQKGLANLTPSGKPGGQLETVRAVK